MSPRAEDQWTPPRDATLLSLVLQKMKFSAIGALLGVTRNAAIGRYHRILKAEERERRDMIARAKANLKKAGAR